MMASARARLCCSASNWVPAYLWKLLPALLASALAVSGTQAAEPTPGAIVGVVTNSAKSPVAHATVTATKADGGGIRATVANSDGVYSLADLPPGKWVGSAEKKVTKGALADERSPASAFGICLLSARIILFSEEH
jgi:hypothetical protein